MRILAIAPQPFFAPRGTPYSVYFRTLTMAEEGAEIDLLTYGIGEEVEIPGVRLLRIPHPPFIRSVKIGPSAAKLFLDLIMIGSFLRRVIGARYDVVHAHEEAVFFAALFKPLFGYRLVYDMHSSLPQQLGNFDFTTSAAIVGPFNWLERLALRRADVVVTVCPDLARHAEQRMPDPNRQLMIENTRFEPIRFARQREAGERTLDDANADPLEFPVGRRVVFYAGSFEPYQGLDRLMRGFAGVLDTVPDAFLVLAGGRDDQVEALRSLADELGIAAHVRLPGPIPQADVRRLLPKAAVLVSSRVSGNNTPLKIYEQLGSGVPLVCTRIRAHTQVLDESIAFLVEPTPESFTDGLVRALTEPEEASHRAAAALEKAEREYSLGTFRSKTAELLERLR